MRLMRAFVIVRRPLTVARGERATPHPGQRGQWVRGARWWNGSRRGYHPYEAYNSRAGWTTSSLLVHPIALAGACGGVQYTCRILATGARWYSVQTVENTTIDRRVSRPKYPNSALRPARAGALCACGRIFASTPRGTAAVREPARLGVRRAARARGSSCRT